MTDKPAEFKTFLAALDLISYDGKKATAVDKDGILYSMLWKAPYIDEKMRKMQQGYYREFTCEVQGDYLVITSIKYVESPEWVRQKFFSKGGKGGGGGKPRNERLIVTQVLLKSWTDLYVASSFPDTDFLDFNKARKAILQAVEEDVDRVMKAGE